MTGFVQILPRRGRWQPAGLTEGLGYQRRLQVHPREIGETGAAGSRKGPRTEKDRAGRVT